MRSRFVWLTAFAAAFLVCGALGCSGTINPKTVKVTGKVTLDGQPLPNDEVQFIPVTPDNKKVEGDIKMASARTESDGSFSLGTFSTNDGAQPGAYRVTVNYSESDVQEFVQGLSDKQKNMKTMLEHMAKEAKSGKKKPARFTVPSKYTNFTQTPLKQTVPPDGSVVLELKSK